ncbi:uncharacterized protein LOC111040841 isoform X2 [Myzus persicae]|uniref:uncharacterized protein LOC111040841 isoform X2 n=1 Tax=Myzus persicae TaxID=13164 RepID=UPI000B937EDE|nr:uncharacterized protein LOC111040841 isoform X2 [Myzus persicae]
MPLTYLIGIPFGWLLLGTFQYFVCIVILGDSFLDPWYFTCAWIVEVISTLPVIMIITMIKCLYVQVEILEHCEKVTWIGFTFLLFQGLAIIILLLPMFRSFSRHFRYANSWKKHETIQVHLETSNQKTAINNDNNIELQELNYHPIFRTK